MQMATYLDVRLSNELPPKLKTNDKTAYLNIAHQQHYKFMLCRTTVLPIGEYFISFLGSLDVGVAERNATSRVS